MKKLAITLLIALVAIGFSFAGGSTETAAATSTAAAPAVKQDTLTVALDGEPQQLDPYAHSNQNGHVITRLVFDTVLTSDLEGNVSPCIATSYEFADATTLNLTIRDDVYFHDGSKLTADDVVYSLALAAKSSFTSNLFGSIDTENTVATDPTHVVVKLKTPNAAIISALASYRGVVVSKNYYETASAEDIARKPMGSGPMKFSDWKSGDRIELVANDNYWGEKCAYSKFVARVIIEGSSRAIELETGGVDVALNLPSTEWARIQDNPKTQLIYGNTQGVAFITFCGDVKPYDDINVRFGLAYALNVPALIEIGWGGKADPADSYYSPTVMGHKNAGLPTFDIAKAKEYLAKAGYNEANPLHVVYTTYDSTLNRNFSEAAQAMWTATGVITCEIQFVDLAQFTTMNNSGALGVSLMTNTAAINDPTAALLAWPLSRTISVRHHDQKVQDYLDAGVAEYDPAKRAAIYGELQDYLASKLYTFPVAFPQNAYGASSAVKNLPFYPTTVPDFRPVSF